MQARQTIKVDRRVSPDTVDHLVARLERHIRGKAEHLCEQDGVTAFVLRNGISGAYRIDPGGGLSLTARGDRQTLNRSAEALARVYQQLFRHYEGNAVRDPPLYSLEF